MRNPSKLLTRLKSEIFKKVESLEKDDKEIKNEMKEIKELLKGKFINDHFVE